MSFFDELGPSNAEQKGGPAFEIVEGRFLCQQDDCWEASREARYFEDDHFITWKCPQGHYSKIVEFVL